MTTGASNDIEQAANRARAMIRRSVPHSYRYHEHNHWRQPAGTGSIGGIIIWSGQGLLYREGTIAPVLDF